MSDKNVERTVGFVPVSGWRAIYLMPDPGGELESAEDDALFYTLDVACLAHVEVQWYRQEFTPTPEAFDASIETFLRPVVAEENKYLGGFEEHSDCGDYILLLGPTDDVDIRANAIEHLERQRPQA